MIEGLRWLRIRLTAWYIGVFAILLLAFVGALFWVIADEASGQLDRSLRKAADAIVAAAEIRVREGAPGPGQVDALDELYIPDRALYLFSADGRLLHPDTASSWVVRMARMAADSGAWHGEVDLPDEHSERFYAAPVALSSGERRVVVAAGEVLEIDHQYPGLLAAFAAAAAAALILAGAGGWMLAVRSTRPVDAAFNRMRQFTADAAHELRTPVAVLKGHAEVALRRDRDTADYVDTLRSIRAEAERLGGILDNVLTLATAEAGAWPERRESVFMDDILLDAASAARVLARDRHVRIDVEALDELPVRADPGLLRQLFMILLDNAIKFTPRSGGIRVRAVREGRQGRIAIEDDGPGIPDAAIEHVFERFYRGDPARGRGTGAGLGLPIARWIARSHEGSVELERAASGGTIATVTLPLQDL